MHVAITGSSGLIGKALTESQRAEAEKRQRAGCACTAVEHQIDADLDALPDASWADIVLGVADAVQEPPAKRQADDPLIADQRVACADRSPHRRHLR